MHVQPGIYDDPRICSLDDWRELWSQRGAVIADEYGRDISTEEMEETILCRGACAGTWSADELAANGATSGPNNLARHSNATPGNGTYDMMQGEFC